MRIFSKKLLVCSVSLSTLVLTSFPASAQLSPSQFQQRIDFCQETEAWLKEACVRSVYEAMNSRLNDRPQVREPSVTPRVSPPVSRPLAEMPEIQIPDIQTPEIPERVFDFTELHMVGVYEGYTKKNSDGSVRQGSVRVNVDRPGEKVALVLASYEPVVWDVVTTPGTSISSVNISGQNTARTQVNLNGDVFEADVISAYVAYSMNGARFHNFYDSVRDEMGDNKAASFSGSYRAPADGFVISSAEGVLTSDEQKAKMQAEALPSRALSSRLQERLMLDKGVGPEYARDEIFKRLSFSEHGFLGETADGEKIEVPLPLTMPRVSHVAGTTYDPRRNQFVAVTFGGAGVFYTYSLRNKEWNAYSMNNVDVGNIFYDVHTDSIFATPGLASREFAKMSPQGKFLKTYDIKFTDFPYLEQVYEPGNGPPPKFEILGAYQEKLLVKTSSRMGGSRSGGANAFYYLIDLESKGVQMVR